MSEKRCENCRWWAVGEWFGEYGDCTNSLVRNTDGLVVADEIDHHIGFHKDFCCPHHEPREEDK